LKAALIYVRVSTPQQADYGESLDVQESICRRYAEQHSFNVAEVFREPYSGRKNDRPWLDRLFAYIDDHPGKIGTVIIRQQQGGWHWAGLADSIAAPSASCSVLFLQVPSSCSPD